MPYIVCKKKKKGNRVHVSVCERCMGVQCADYLNYVQLSLFPSFVKENMDYRKPFSPEKTEKKKSSETESPQQILLFDP
jgi:hypothetical protein